MPIDIASESHVELPALLIETSCFLRILNGHLFVLGYVRVEVRSREVKATRYVAIATHKNHNESYSDVLWCWSEHRVVMDATRHTVLVALQYVSDFMT